MKRHIALVQLLSLLLLFFALATIDDKKLDEKPRTQSGINRTKTATKATPQAKPKAIAQAKRKAIAKPQPLKGKTIVLDPGHGGTDPGAVSGKVREQHVTLHVVRELKRELEKLGAKVILTRNKDVFVSLADRVKLSEKIKPDAFLSVHVNACSNPKADGIEAFYTWKTGARLAYPVFYALSCKLGAPARYVHKRKLYVTRYTSVPAALIEIGYLTHPKKRYKLSDKAYRKQIAKALAHGLLLYFKKRRETGHQ